MPGPAAQRLRGLLTASASTLSHNLPTRGGATSPAMRIGAESHAGSTRPVKLIPSSISAALALLCSAVTLSSCGGGGGATGATAPAWSNGSLAIGRLADGVVQAVSDGAGGLLVVNARVSAPDSFEIQQFTAAGVWNTPVVTATGWREVRAVAIPGGGVALIGRDSAAWYRADWLASGAQIARKIADASDLVTDGDDSRWTDFSFAANGALVASAVVTSGNGKAVKVREYQNGQWTAPTLASGERINPNLFDVSKLLRSREGDVLDLNYLTVSSGVSFAHLLALRAPTSTSLQPTAVTACSGKYCGADGRYQIDALRLEADGSATARFRHDDVSDWLSLRPQTSAQPNLVAREAGNSDDFAGPATAVVRADGRPVWLTAANGTFDLVEAGTKVTWVADPTAKAACVTAGCIALRRDDAQALASLRVNAAGQVQLHISERSADGSWTGSPPIELTGLRYPRHRESVFCTMV